MNIHNYFAMDVVNGPGTRCSLFVSGCSHHCRGCYNQSTWDPRAGVVFTDIMADQIINDLNDARIYRRGLSLSGGDPLFPANVEAIGQLVRRVRAECPGKDIFMWTGYRYDELSSAQQQVVSLIDVLIDGRFEAEQANPELLWRGSANQQIHYINPALAGLHEQFDHRLRAL